MCYQCIHNQFVIAIANVRNCLVVAGLRQGKTRRRVRGLGTVRLDLRAMSLPAAEAGSLSTLQAESLGVAVVEWALSAQEKVSRTHSAPGSFLPSSVNRRTWAGRRARLAAAA